MEYIQLDLFDLIDNDETEKNIDPCDLYCHNRPTCAGCPYADTNNN